MLFNNISAKRRPLSAVISRQLSRASFYGNREKKKKEKKGRERKKKEGKKERPSLRWQPRGETNAATTMLDIPSRWRRRDREEGNLSRGDNPRFKALEQYCADTSRSPAYISLVPARHIHRRIHTDVGHRHFGVLLLYIAIRRSVLGFLNGSTVGAHDFGRTDILSIARYIDIPF